MKKTFFLALLFFIPALTAQGKNLENESAAPETRHRVEAEVGVGLRSSYISRGSCNGGVGIYPEMSVGYRGLSLSAWAFVGFDNKDAKELNLILGYKTGGLQLEIIDFWYLPHDENEQIGFFKFGAHHTQHQFEGHVAYDFGFLSASWRTMFAGFDHLENGKRAYSTYVSFHVPFRLGGLEWEGAAALTPWESCYSRSFNFVHLALKATKEVQITRSFSLPVFAALTLNPNKERVYFTAGFKL